MSAPPSHHSQLAVTMGDPAGIGPDIILMAHAAREALRGVNSLPRFAVFADPAVLSARARRLGLSPHIREIAPTTEDFSKVPANALAIVPIPCQKEAIVGEPSSDNGPAVISCIEKATARVADGTFSALVTAPISKATVYGSGFAYPGHTEFLAALAEKHVPGRRYSSVMMIASDLLRVVPLTIHVPLVAVPPLITEQLVTETIEIVHHALTTDFGIASPRIAIAGLNPHAGEAGTLGREEQDVIVPALDAMRGKGLTLIGPLSGDTLFHAAARATYDVVVAMYHDQALIPIKTLAFDTGVNVTLGLPFVRTSPDHGTAFDIAGSGKASPASFFAALNLARDLAANRAATSH